MVSVVAEIVSVAVDRASALERAEAALRAGELVVVPTDTVYGVAADAFQPAATAKIFATKRRSRRFPLPVLVRGPKQLLGLAEVVPEAAERLMAAYWPGPLTIVLRAGETLAWDLGDDARTVAVRMPLDDVTLELIRAVGPIACTSANLSGQPPATNVDEARRQLGDAVAVYVDDGARGDTAPSTIVDVTGGEVRVLREGAVSAAEARAVAAGADDGGAA